MRAISLRQFRDHIADIGEPVQVQRRDKTGTFHVLGVWQPFLLDLPGAPPLDPIGTVRPRIATSQQAERDRLLRKINHGG